VPWRTGAGASIESTSVRLGSIMRMRFNAIGVEQLAPARAPRTEPFATAHAGAWPGLVRSIVQRVVGPAVRFERARRCRRCAGRHASARAQLGRGVAPVALDADVLGLDEDQGHAGNELYACAGGVYSAAPMSKHKQRETPMKKARQRQSARAQSAGSGPEPNPVAHYWVVAFLDLLGYRVALAKLDYAVPPQDPAGIDALSRGFANVVKPRRRLLRDVDRYIKQLSNPDLPLTHVSSEHRDFVASTRAIQIARTAGPDHIVLASTTFLKPGHFPLRALHTMFHASSIACLFQLAYGSEDVDSTLPVRGGIDLGMGVWLDDNLYSPAVANAYELESCKATYPRIILSDRLLGLIQSELATDDGDHSPERRADRTIAGLVRALLIKDPTDDRTMLDFLGPEMRRGLNDANHARTLAADAWAFVQAAEIKHRSNPQVAPKYDWLVNYMKPRLPAWGVTP
jgi:hypothetical protein